MSTEKVKANSLIRKLSPPHCKQQLEVLTVFQNRERFANQLLAVCLVGIRSIEEQIKSLDKAIELFMAAFQNVLISIPGIGPVYSAGLIAEIGDIERFDQGQASLAKYAGLAWAKFKSGGFEAANTKLILTGNKYLKYYLLEAANKARMHDAEFAEYYRIKFREVHKHQHKRALALTARKLVRLVYSLAEYQPPLYAFYLFQYSLSLPFH